jgi:putative ABC transport system substrate-binding protein
VETRPILNIRRALRCYGRRCSNWAGPKVTTSGWSSGDSDLARRYARELVALAPDVILPLGSPNARAVQQATRTVPIVFAQVSDPVASGFVQSLARPGGNTTGFMQFEFGLSGKWLELLKQVAPDVTRAAVLRDPDVGTGTTQFAIIQAMAPLLRVEVNPVNVRDPSEIRRAVEAFARSPNGGLIVTASALALHHRDLITMLAARHRLPAVYPFRHFVISGGLISYWDDPSDQYRRAAGYVDRILKGAKPADLPVQAPTKYDLVINLKTAKALGLDVPPTALASADEVIERSGASSSRCSAARQRRGRSRLARSSQNECGALVCWCHTRRRMRKQKRASVRSDKSFRSWGGAKVETSSSSLATAAAAASACALYAAAVIGLAPDVKPQLARRHVNDINDSD